MLTIKSNLNNFRDRQGEGYTPEDLDLLCKALIKSDIINFPIKKEMSAGFTSAIAWKIAERLKLNETGKYLVINDISLQIANVLVSLGVNPKNIYLAYGKWTKKAEPDTDPTLYLLMRQYIKANIVETFTVIKLEEIFTLGTKFDGIIANPPYGKIGAQITNTIKDKVDYEQYISLLPMVDYEKLQKEKIALWQYVDIDSIISTSFGDDAAIAPLICNILKTKCNDLSADAFRIACLENKSTVKYFTHNMTQPYTFYIIEQFADNDLTCTIALPMRVKSGNHSGQANLGKTLKSQFFQINNGYKTTVTDQEVKSICCTTVNFKTAQEKENAAAFLYSDIGYKFASWIMTGMNRDAFHLREHSMWFPRIDWTRAWTVEEILTDYGYTTNEIAEVMTDLNNYKGMETVDQ